MQPQQFPHFFITTLGDAQQINNHYPHHISTIDELLVLRARDSPDAVAVGMGIPPETGGSEGKWGTVVYSAYTSQDPFWLLKILRTHDSESILPALEGSHCHCSSSVGLPATSIGGLWDRKWPNRCHIVRELMGYASMLPWTD